MYLRYILFLKQHMYLRTMFFLQVFNALWVQTGPSRASRATGASASASAIFKGKSVLVQVLV